MNIVDHVLVKEMISTASENTESTERESSLPPPSRQKPFYVFFSLIPIRFASFSTHSSPPHPVFILAHLLCSNPFFLSLTRCRGSANWSRLCHDTGTWHNCWTNSVPFSIRPVSAKQHAVSNWLETLITGPVPQRLIGRGFPQEWGCLCAHVCRLKKELTAGCVCSWGRCQDEEENTYCSIWEINTQVWYICVIKGFKCFFSSGLSIERSQITFLLCTISYSVSLEFLVEQPQSYQETNKTCFINSCHVFSSVFTVINEHECVFWSTVCFLLIQSKLNFRRCWQHYIVLWFSMSLKVEKQDFI